MITTKSLPLGFILKKIQFELIYVLLVGMTVHFLASRFKAYLPEMPLYVPAFLGTAISILLSFEMSQSYDRWWEARKIWGVILNESRTLIVQLRSALQHSNSHALVKTVSYRQIAWCYSFGQFLRGQDPLQNTDTFLSQADLGKLKNKRNIPLLLLQMNADAIMELKHAQQIDGFIYTRLDTTIKNLVDAMGSAERINNTVFPVTYRIFLHFSVYLFVTILSIALQDVPLYYELPLLVTISGVFFLLEKSSTHIQDPFRNRPNDTPVSSIAKTAEINIKELLQETDIQGPEAPHSFYLL
jgi:ion channel-forming bestrophin family protein